MIDKEVARKAGVSEEELSDLCYSVFGNQNGKKLLEALCRYRHPMASRFENSDQTQAAIRDGEANIVSFLWRNGSQSTVLP